MDFVEEASQRSKHMANFDYSVGGDDPVVVAIRGEVDAFTAPELSATFADLLSARNRNVVLDLSGVEFIDSSGLHVLTQAASGLQEAAGSLQVSAASHRVRRVIELAGMDGLLPLPAASDGMES